MSSDPATGLSPRFVASVLLGTGLLVFAIVRASLWFDDFSNPDIGAIASTADLILAGGLPYVDTIEFKPPGVGFLFAGVFALLGRSLDALQIAYAAWLLLGAGAIWLGARDPSDPRPAALATAVYLLYAGMFDFNYSAWMMPAYAWAWVATQRGLSRPTLSWSIAAGALGVLAFTLKQQAVVLGLAMIVAWLLARRRGAAGARSTTPLWWLLGGAIGLLPLTLRYAIAGELPALYAGLFAFGKVAAYAQAGGAHLGPLALVGAVLAQLVRTFPVALALACVAGVAAALDRKADRAGPPMLDTVVLLLVSIAAGGLGGARFYLHYLVQDLPALALLAGHPATVGLLGRGPAPSRAHALARALGWIVVSAATIGQALQIAGGDGHRYDAIARRLESGKTAAQVAGQHIAARTRADETIFVWGWTAWRVPFWADRKLATRVHKELGTLTEFNTNSAFEPARPIHFVPGPYADEVLQAFSEAPPSYIVHSDSFTTTFGCDRDPLLEFEALTELILRDYVPEAQYGDLRLYVRRSR
ncbi:MAG: glycosyltransferase family 39 protein [Enhygromyxa sp.]